MILRIRTLGDPVLREPAKPVDDFGRSLRALHDDMIETMRDAPGVGLAGPQVGISRRLLVFDDGETGPMFMANPQLLDPVGELLEDEGCLSIPGPYASLSSQSDATVVSNSARIAGDRSSPPSRASRKRATSLA